MDDHEVLQHLLNLEAEAAALVNDAQAEADRRISEGEKLNRSRYDGIYAKEAAALEARFALDLAVFKENYEKQLEEYRESLITQPRDAAAFSSLAEKFLFMKDA